MRGDEIDAAQLSKLAEGAARASLALDDSTWAVWVAQVYRRVPLVMPEEVVNKLSELASRFPHDMADPGEQLAVHVRTVPSTPAEAPAIAALELVRASVAPMSASKPALS